MNDSKYKGFTLIELIIVIGIISVLSAVAIPQYKKYTNSAKLVELMMFAEPYKLKVANALSMGDNSKIDKVTYNQGKVKTVEVKNIDNSSMQIEITGDKKNFSLTKDPKIRYISSIVEDMILWECQILDLYEDYAPNSCKNTFTV